MRFASDLESDLTSEAPFHSKQICRTRDPGLLWSQSMVLNPCFHIWQPFLLIISKESQSAIQFFHYRWWCKVDGLLGATPHMAIRIAKGQLRSLARSISRHFTRIICSLELLIRAIKCLNFSVNNPSKANRLQYLVRKMLVYLWLFS